MQTKNYFAMTNFLAILFKVILFILLFTIPLAWTIFFLKGDNLLSFEPNFFFSIGYTQTILPLSTTEIFLKNISLLLANSVALLSGSRCLYLASSLFKTLSLGEIPFTLNNVRQLTKITQLLFFIGLLPQLLYYPLLILTIQETYLLVGLNLFLIISGVLFVVKEIFRYGVQLQTFSEDVV
ncbi:hypothetical protein [Enterococcus nangangensis]|uniref:hypothetical protein n=1 Tax=Enterococcus nangangensis TaxID=2559926 RepID=UPI0010F5D4EF|nr:hypothetical protein [Enterococcus nangangensis]